MKKIFLDVGGHRGETLETVLSPTCHFDLVHCFEPIPELAKFIQTKFANDITAGKLQVHNFGLADFTGAQKLYGTGPQEEFGDGLAASLFADKKDIDNRHSLTCEFVKASDFLQQHTAADDLVILKMNCEGGEILILRNLMASGTIHNLHFIYIDFDAVKIPSQQQEKKKVLAELKAVKFKRFITDENIYPTCNNADRTKRILSALPNAKEFITLTKEYITLNKIRLYAPATIYRKISRRHNKILQANMSPSLACKKGATNGRI